MVAHFLRFLLHKHRVDQNRRFWDQAQSQKNIQKGPTASTHMFCKSGGLEKQMCLQMMGGRKSKHVGENLNMLRKSEDVGENLKLLGRN